MELMVSNRKDRVFRHSLIKERGTVQVLKYGDLLSNYSIDKETGDLVFQLPDGTKHRILIDNPIYAIDPRYQTRVLEKANINQNTEVALNDLPIR